MIFLPEEPGSDYKPCNPSAVQKIIIDGDKDKPDEGKDVGLSNVRGRWGELNFSMELPLDMSSKKIIRFGRTPNTRIDSLNLLLVFLNNFKLSIKISRVCWRYQNRNIKII